MFCIFCKDAVYSSSCDARSAGTTRFHGSCTQNLLRRLAVLVDDCRMQLAECRAAWPRAGWPLDRLAPRTLSGSMKAGPASRARRAKEPQPVTGYSVREQKKRQPCCARETLLSSPPYNVVLRPASFLLLPSTTAHTLHLLLCNTTDMLTPYTGIAPDSSEFI